MAKSGSRTPMSDAHKAALAQGRNEGRVVRRYLEALEARRPKRGRKRTPASIKQQLDRVVQELAGADPLKRLQLLQERMDLEAELSDLSTSADLTALEAEFVAVAAAYGSRKHISYAAWREAGIDAAVLRRAGISRGSSSS